jgi:hypothetical protein
VGGKRSLGSWAKENIARAVGAMERLGSESDVASMQESPRIVPAAGQAEMAKSLGANPPSPPSSVP